MEKLLSEGSLEFDPPQPGDQPCKAYLHAFKIFKAAPRPLARPGTGGLGSACSRLPKQLALPRLQGLP